WERARRPRFSTAATGAAGPDSRVTGPTSDDAGPHATAERANATRAECDGSLRTGRSCDEGRRPVRSKDRRLPRGFVSPLRWAPLSLGAWTWRPLPQPTADDTMMRG